MAESARRLCIDTAAYAAFGHAVVMTIDRQTVAVCETIEEAEAMVAEANGVDVETVRHESEEQAQLLHEYRRNLIAASKQR